MNFITFNRCDVYDATVCTVTQVLKLRCCSLAENDVCFVDFHQADHVDIGNLLVFRKLPVPSASLLAS